MQEPDFPLPLSELREASASRVLEPLRRAADEFLRKLAERTDLEHRMLVLCTPEERRRFIPKLHVLSDDDLLNIIEERMTA